MFLRIVLVSCASALQPGGAIGVLLQSKTPFRHSSDDILGSTLNGRSRFKVVVANGSSLHQRRMGKLGSSVDKLAMKWFLKASMAFSEEFDQCTHSRTRSKVAFLLCIM